MLNVFIIFLKKYMIYKIIIRLKFNSYFKSRIKSEEYKTIK